MEYLAKGKRGLVFLTTYEGKKAVVKTKRPEAAVDTLQNEATFLKRLNQHGIGPKLYLYEAGKLTMEYIDGLRIDDHVERADKKTVIKTIMAVLEQCRTLDKLGITKFEMHHPHKHIIVTRKGPVMIDFERCRFTERPKNVSQFVQFLTSSTFGRKITAKGINIDASIRNTAETYKKTLSEEDYKKIRSCIK